MSIHTPDRSTDLQRGYVNEYVYFIIFILFILSDLKTLTNSSGCCTGVEYLTYTETRFLLTSLPHSVVIHSMFNTKVAFFQL